jgi:hypothetical protein
MSSDADDQMQPEDWEGKDEPGAPKPKQPMKQDQATENKDAAPPA